MDYVEDDDNIQGRNLGEYEVGVEWNPPEGRKWEDRRKKINIKPSFICTCLTCLMQRNVKYNMEIGGKWKRKVGEEGGSDPPAPFPPAPPV